MYERFVQFFEDVLPEFQKLGNVIQFEVREELYHEVVFI